MRNFNIVVIVTLMFICFACQNDAVMLPKSHPLPVLKAVTNISSKGVVLQAEMLNSETMPIIEKGFVISKDHLPTLADRKIVANTHFESIVDSDMLMGVTYSVRAYVLTEKYTIYSNHITFNSKGAISPKVSQVFPAYGSPGSLFSIVGNYFSELKTNNLVKFGETIANVAYASKDSLVVQCPVAKYGEQEVTMQVGDYTIAVGDFNLISPWSRKTDFPAEGRYRSSSFTIGSKGYVTMGRELYAGFASTDLWEYDTITGTWTNMAMFPGEKREQAIGCTINGMGYVGLGYDYESNYVQYNDLWQFNPQSNEWKRMADFPGGESAIFMAHCVVNDKLYVKTRVNSILYVFDPVTNNWSQWESDGAYKDKYFLEGVSLKGKGYFIDANDGKYGEKRIVLWELDHVNHQVRPADTLVVNSSYVNKGTIVIGHKLFFSARSGKLIEFDTKNKLSLYHKHPSNEDLFNFIFEFDKRAVVNNAFTTEVYQFYQQ